MIGSVDHVAYKSHLINSNFHARLLHVMDPELKFSEKLENFFNARIEAHKLEKQKLVKKISEQHSDAIKIAQDKHKLGDLDYETASIEPDSPEKPRFQPHFNLPDLDTSQMFFLPKTVFNELPNHEGGIDFQKQAHMLAVSNQAVSESIVKLSEELNEQRNKLKDIQQG